jgi:LysR family glycine cleavage system transcriptional activator
MTDHLPPLEWIKVFAVAARHGNFSSAADELGLTQAAISQRVRNLELKLGTQLFNRHARGVTLTTQGEAWLPHVEIALQQLGRSTADLFAAPRRKMTIVASTSVIELWIVPRLARIMQALPHVQLVFETMQNMPDYERAESDFQIRFGNGEWAGLGSALLYREELAPVAASSLSSTPDWRSLPLIATSGPRHGWRDWFDHSGELPAGVPVLRFDTFVQAMRAAEAGAGVLLGSLPLCRPAIKAGRLQRLDGKSLPMDVGYWITWDNRAPVIRERATLLDCLVSAN